MLKKLLIVTIIILVAATGYAQEEYTDEELLFMDITVATGDVGLSFEETPGTIEIISGDEIRKWGSRNFTDVMRMVPGFHVEYDLTGILGLGVRGNWANEGKALLLWDGIEINDAQYSSLNLGNRFPIDSIKKIEILRGPGSAIYGGAAELAVISVHTKKPKKEREFSLTGTYGHSKFTFARQNVTGFLGGKNEEKGLSWSADFHGGKGNLSDAKTTDLYQNPLDLSDNNNSLTKTFFANMNLNYNGLDVRLIVDRWFNNYAYPNENNNAYFQFWYNYFLQAEYKHKVNDRLTIIPKFKYTHEQPWYIPRPERITGELLPLAWEVRMVSELYSAEVKALYDVKENLHLTAGSIYDIASTNDQTNLGGLASSSNHVTYENLAMYYQVLYDTSLANFMVGGRYTKNSHSDEAFVPRASITKTIGDYYFKTIYSEAYREPKSLNVAATPGLIPETTRVIEFEAGGQITKNWKMIFDFFDIRIEDAIIYSFTGSEVYENVGTTGTWGIEVTNKYKTQSTDSTLAYSFYKAKKDDGVPDYAVAGQPQLNKGMATHKLTMATSWQPMQDRKFFVTPTILFFNQRHSLIRADADDNLFTGKVGESLLFNLALLYEDFYREDLDVTLSLYNITDRKHDFLPTYIGYEGNYTGPSREVVLKVSYDF